MINWSVKKTEAKLIRKIAKRASKMAAELPVLDYPVQDAEMDITAAHANGCPLRLKELAEADDANFGHDVFGIRKFMDRNTAQIEGHFWPRLSKRDN